MTTTGVSSVFIDTNVLVYANVTNAPLHAKALQAIRSFEQASVPLWISRQTLREYLATLTRIQSFTAPVPPNILANQVQHFEARFNVAEENAQVTQKLLNLIQTFNFGGRQIHDANIVATMLVHNISHVITNNVSDFKRFSNLINIIPL